MNRPLGEPVIGSNIQSAVAQQHTLLGSVEQKIVAELSAVKVLFQREPALWLGLIAGVVQFVSAQIFPLTVDQQGALNAVASAVLGVVLAFAVSTDQGVPAILGLAKALIALGLAFGLHLDPHVQASAMALLELITSFFTRTQVTAPVPLATLKRLPATPVEGQRAA